jgi:ankyrin repeat protein
VEEVIQTMDGGEEGSHAEQLAMRQASLEKYVESGNVADSMNMIAQHADPNKRDNMGYTPLHRAAMRGDENVVQTWIDVGALHNLQNAWGNTPLHLASGEHGGANIVQTLLAANADPSVRNQHDESMLGLAVEHGQNAAVTLLLAALPPGADGVVRLYEALDMAAQRNRYHIAPALIDRLGEAPVDNPDGPTALWWAARHQHADMVRTLLEAKADPGTIAPDQGQSALEAAESSGSRHPQAQLVIALLNAALEEKRSKRAKFDDWTV